MNETAADKVLCGLLEAAGGRVVDVTFTGTLVYPAYMPSEPGAHCRVGDYESPKMGTGCKELESDSEKLKSLLWKERDELTAKLQAARVALLEIAHSQGMNAEYCQAVAREALEVSE